MRVRAGMLAVLCCLLVGAVAVSGVAMAGDGGIATIAKKKVKKKKKNNGKKVAVCHRTGNGSFHLIRVGKPALKAHLRHGDVLPNGQGQCPPPPAPEVMRFFSPPLDFGPMGWGGWSCPTGMHAVGGGHNLADVTAAGIAQPGATVGGFTYPTFPHYTFPAGETGFVVQNDNDTEEDRTVFVDCVPNT